jgi:solute carrier family 25 phosphate transporter 23/24/25/41
MLLANACGGVSSGVQLGDQELDAFMHYIDQDNNGKITFGEWRDFLLLYPREATLPNIYQYWEKISLVDIGEQAVSPEGIGEHHRLTYLVAGAVSRTATAPLDRLKVLLAVQTHSTTASILHGLKHIYILKISPESAMTFYAYEIMKKVVVGDGHNGEIGPVGRLVAGGAAGRVYLNLTFFIPSIFSNSN